MSDKRLSDVQRTHTHKADEDTAVTSVSISVITWCVDFVRLFSGVFH